MSVAPIVNRTISSKCNHSLFHFDNERIHLFSSLHSVRIEWNRGGLRRPGGCIYRIPILFHLDLDPCTSLKHRREA